MQEFDGFLPEEEDGRPEPSLSATEDGRPAMEPAPARSRKVYKLADSAVAILGGRLAKRKAEALAAAQEETMNYDGDVERRSNAILIRGPPIKHLSTDKIFAYTGHYATAAEQIEWIDDESCVLVYSSSSTAMAAFSALKKSRESSSAESGMEGEEEMTMCQPVPALLWPIEERLSKSLGKSQGLTGHIVMRWALKTDVKQRGSRNKSEFYKKHGDPNDTTPLERSKKRRRWDDDDSLASRLDAEPNEHAARAHDRAALDAELDAFVSRGEINAGITASPKEAGSIGSLMDRLGPLIDSREVAPLPRRKGRDGGYGRGPSREQRPTTDKETLDAELDAFLKDREG